MSGALQKTPLRQVQSVKELLMNDGARNQLAMVAAKHMNPERMMRVVANAIRTTPKLQNCEPMSFLGALMHCASMGLEPNTPLGHAYLIPFDRTLNRGKKDERKITEVQVVIGYKGFIDLARRSGQLASIHGDVVYSDDEVWSHEYGSNQHLRHRPGLRKGKRLGAYCHVKLNLGEGITAEGHRFMSIEEIIAHRNQHSQGWKTAVKYNNTDDSPWNEKNPQFEAMAIKTVVRALANRGELPMSIEFMEAMQVDEAKADFRGFAMDPTGGMTIDADAEEGEVEETQVDQRQIEQTTDVSVDAGRDRRRAAPVILQEDESRATRRRAKPPAEEDQKRRDEPDHDGQSHADDDERPTRDVTKMGLYRQWAADVDSIGFDGAKSLWDDGGELQSAEQNDPELYAAMMSYGAQSEG
ncbi:MAG: recombinase RecT [Proteobacteria bacterium]|nr:recombinase RecT [Pseudomonadota bacterium]